MTVKIPLRLRGIDLRDVETYNRIDPDLSDLSWEANGGVSLAVLYSDDPFPVAKAADWARRIAKSMPGVEVAEAHDELVSISDIAARANVAAEAARLWATGKRRASLRPFPSPRQVVGSGSGSKSMSLYAWREVLSWIREIIGIDPDEGVNYLDDSQHANLNADLAAIAAAAAWLPIHAEEIRIEIAEIHLEVAMHGTRPADVSAFAELGAELRGETSTSPRRGTLRVA